MSELISCKEARSLMPSYILRANKLEENIKRANGLIRAQAKINKRNTWLIVNTQTEAEELASALDEKGFFCNYKYVSGPEKEGYKVIIAW